MITLMCINIMCVHVHYVYMYIIIEGIYMCMYTGQSLISSYIIYTHSYARIGICWLIIMCLFF